MAAVQEQAVTLRPTIRKPETFAWLVANASRFGFERTVRGEPWHWEYINAPRASGDRLASSSKTPAAKKSANKSMKRNVVAQKASGKKSSASGRGSRVRSRRR